MLVKLPVCLIFLCTVICVLCQYQNYPGGAHGNYPGWNNQNNSGSQYQNYPGNQNANYPGGYQNYQGKEQTYPPGNYHDYPGAPGPIFPAPQPPFKQNNYGGSSYNRTGNTPSWQTRPFTTPRSYGNGQTNHSIGWYPNGNVSRPHHNVAPWQKPFTTPRYGIGPANGNITRPRHNQTSYITSTSHRPFQNPSQGGFTRPNYPPTSPRPFGYPAGGNNGRPPYNNTTFQNGFYRPYGNNSYQPQWNNTRPAYPRPGGVNQNYPYGGSTSTVRTPYQQPNYPYNPYVSTTTYRPLYPGNSLNNIQYPSQHNTTPVNPYNPALYNVFQVPGNCAPGYDNVNGACRPVYN